ncbi:hypothetical protein [Thermodesulfatator atlanticus]|uniref:hypothetical protein n=1 Tax=Thermodesulfatator atlanticus TaxID=501497 RepID=UPI0003B34D41|nr:hypothetical protein [Thermodesulfatator atlanticus]
MGREKEERTVLEDVRVYDARDLEEWLEQAPAVESDNEEEDLPQELIKQRARLAWRLLNTWRIVPGSDVNGKIDYQKLKSWIEKARELCRNMDRLGVCNNHIGQVLAHAVPDENGNWPPEEVCRIIDEIQSKKIENGFSTEIYKKRGVVTKSPFEGGKQERELAEKYQKYANKWAIKYPRTAAVLRKIAENYELEAKREDEEAEKRRLEW